MNKVFYATAMFLLFAITHAESYKISSPNKKANATIKWDGSKLTYSLSRSGKTLVHDSLIELKDGKTYKFDSKKISNHKSSWQSVHGLSKTIVDQHQELKLTFKNGDKEKLFIARLFNDGFGMRFALNNVPNSQGTFTCEYKLDSTDQAYAHKGEKPPAGPMKLSAKKVGGKIPFVINKQDSWIAFFESDLYTAKAFKTMGIGKSKTANTLVSNTPFKSSSANMLTPWRVITFAQRPGQLAMSTTAVNLAAPCEIEDPSWITPGQSLWDWRVHGYKVGDFEYDINTESYIRMIDFAAANNIEYLTVDDHWYLKAKDGKMQHSPAVDIKKTVAYAKSKGVKIILYYDNKKGKFGDEHLYKYYASLGVSGIKYGFMGNNANFTRGAVKTASEYKLTMNFHDGPVPMTGISRTLPNLVTREYCHAQQDSRKAYTPESFLKMAVIEALTGPLDMANGNFGLKSINAGERKKGPKKQNSYVSTVVSEVARTLIIASGVVTYPDAPEEYAKKADLFAFLKALPGAWDESIEVDSKMAEYMAIARRSGKTWFLATANNSKKRTLTLKLDFLEAGKTYQATLFKDTPESHGSQNPEVYEIVKQTVKKGDTLTFDMAVGGGFAAKLEAK